ncbi:MAG TPA: response regulator [Microvirga sp.]|jgi:two-component system response regulator|nr:response regulator [Microvirga sp.]
MERIPTILLVDDNPGDIALTQEAFQECGLSANFLTASDGLEALALLSKSGIHAEVATPDFILLDLNLPRMSGREVLSYIKQSDRLKRIPTIILSTSSRQQDIEQCYELCANTYIVKPVQWSQFLAIVRSFEAYWFSVATLPSTTA